MDLPAAVHLESQVDFLSASFLLCYIWIAQYAFAHPSSRILIQADVGLIEVVNNVKIDDLDKHSLR